MKKTIVAFVTLFTVMIPGQAVASLPADTELSLCAEEDGFGQSLCMWDGVVSGDCAPGFVGSDKTSIICRELFSQDSYTYENQGATISVPSGKALVNECVEEYNLSDDMTTDDLGECFTANLR